MTHRTDAMARVGYDGRKARQESLSRELPPNERHGLEGDAHDVVAAAWSRAVQYGDAALAFACRRLAQQLSED